MTYEFESLSYSEALKMADEGETWLVDNIIGSSTTLIYGEAKSGKSFLVSALIKSLATGADFVNKPVPQDRAFSVAVCWTDDRGAQEYSERIRTVMPDEETPTSGSTTCRSCERRRCGVRCTSEWCQAGTISWSSTTWRRP